MWKRVLNKGGGRDGRRRGRIPLVEQLGQHPRPSSEHPGGVNMLWCDGRVTFVSQNIDDHVYICLLSPAGGRYGQPIVTPPD